MKKYIKPILIAACRHPSGHVIYESTEVADDRFRKLNFSGS